VTDQETALFEQVWRVIREMNRDGVRPREIRLGAEEYYAIKRVEAHAHGGMVDTLSTPGVVYMFGVPVRPLPLAHAVSVT
jgi:hypothetical protein